MLKKIFFTLLIFTFVNITILANQTVSNSAPNYVEEYTANLDNANTTVAANAPIENLTAQLYYNEIPLEDDTIISQDNNNQDLLLSESWELTPFSIKINGSELENYGLTIELEVGFFQLLDSNGNIAQGDDGYIIESQSMKIININPINNVSFENSPSGSNFYYYNIPLTNYTYYNNESMANFKLTWQQRNIPVPGNYISNIQVTFSIN